MGPLGSEPAGYLLVVGALLATAACGFGGSGRQASQLANPASAYCSGSGWLRSQPSWA